MCLWGQATVPALLGGQTQGCPGTTNRLSMVRSIVQLAPATTLHVVEIVESLIRGRHPTHERVHILIVSGVLDRLGSPPSLMLHVSIGKGQSHSVPVPDGWVVKPLLEMEVNRVSIRGHETFVDHDRSLGQIRTDLGPLLDVRALDSLGPGRLTAFMENMIE